jgi:hypothetical protein
MIRWIPLGLLTLAVGVTASSGATTPSPFPLTDGNRWTLRDVDRNTPRTISARQTSEGMVVSGFPGLADMRMRWSGQTLQAWDSSQGRWEALFRFGAAAGERYAVNLADTYLWRSLVVTVSSKRAAVRDFRGRAVAGCTRFTFESRRPIADAGLEEISFAPGVGPVRIVDTTIAGRRVLALASRSLK